MLRFELWRMLGASLRGCLRLSTHSPRTVESCLKAQQTSENLLKDKRSVGLEILRLLRGYPAEPAPAESADRDLSGASQESLLQSFSVTDFVYKVWGRDF
jgi:hypothetical protein